MNWVIKLDLWMLHLHLFSSYHFSDFCTTMLQVIHGQGLRKSQFFCSLAIELYKEWNVYLCSSRIVTKNTNKNFWARQTYTLCCVASSKKRRKKYTLQYMVCSCNLVWNNSLWSYIISGRNLYFPIRARLWNRAYSNIIS